MDNDSADDEQQKGLSISIAASSMINATGLISRDAYEANLKHIQEVKEVARRLEMNNETAHKNFLVDELEKRAQDGREAEIMLARLRSQPGLTEMVQFTNNVPNDNPEVILPTSATLVEVPESPSSPYFTPTSTVTPPQITQQIRPIEYRRSTAPQAPQPQSYQSGNYPYYPPSFTARPPHSAAPRSQVPVNAQMGWYITPNVAPQFGTHNPSAPIASFQPLHVRQPTQSWSSYSHQVVSSPAANTVPGNYTAPPGWTRTAPPQSAGAGTSSAMYHHPKFPAQSVVSAPPLNTNPNQPQNVPLLAPNPQVQVPVYGVTTHSAKVSSSQPPVTRTQPQLAENQFRPAATTVSMPVAISELQRSHQQPAPPAPQHHQQQFQPQQHPQPPQSHRYSQEVPSQRPLQQPQTHRQAPARPAERVPSISQAYSQPSRAPDSLPAVTSAGTSQAQTPHLTVAQEQARPQSAQYRADQATFVKFFQAAVQRGAPYLKAFLLQAKTCGISEDWFRAAFNSMSREVWESIVAQANQSGPTVDVSSSVNVPQAVPTVPGPNIPVVNAEPSAPAPPIQTTTTSQSVVEPNSFAKGNVARFAEGQTSQLYAAHLQYYAEQATKSALPAQVASISTSPITPAISNVVVTPTRDRPQVQVNVRTPKHANKSTLARDVLRSLGKIAPEPCPEIGGEPTDKPHSDQLPTINIAQEISHEAALAAPNPPEVPPATGVIHVDSPSVPSAEPDAMAEPQQISPLNLPIAKPVLKEKPAVIGGPIMIDLTLDDSDESVDGKRQEPTFPIQTSTFATASSQPAFPANSANRTPLLENLSLEERPIDIAANGDDADVRMYSPPLSMHAEEESELLHPQLDVAELGPPSFEPLPREASVHPLDGQLPLFLPSPPVSPAAHTEPPETDLEMISEDGNSRSYLKRHAANADEKEIDTEPVAPRVKKRRKQAYVLVPPAPLYVKKAIKKMKERAMGKEIDSELECVGEDEELQYSPLEQLLIEESKSRLLERRCRWLNCGAILNCASNLFVHLRNHAREEDSEAPFFCRWSNCQRQFDMRQERDVHLEKHTIRPLPCPFAGCDEQFNKPVEVMQHEVQHQQAERAERLIRKPTCRPVVPAIPARLGQPPHKLPSHRVIPRRVVKCRISAERHATMGPWVLWNIFGPVELNTRKQNASMRGRPMRQTVQHEMDSSDPRRDDYDFLLALSTYPGKNPQLDELDSNVVTMSVARGLTLWGSESAINSGERSATPDESTSVEVLKEKWEGSEEKSRPASAVLGEEDAVERMLIL